MSFIVTKVKNLTPSTLNNIVKKKTVRAGLVGSGFSAAFHYHALCKVHGVNVEVVGVFSLDKSGGRKFAKERDIRFFESLGDLLDEVEAIHVCVPGVDHESVSVAGLSQGKFVICEKPLTGYFGDGAARFPLGPRR